MKVDIPGALRSLQQVVDRIAVLIEWEKLARQERKPHVPPSFQPADHFYEDLEMMCASFWNLVYDIHEAINRPDVAATDEQRRRWKRQLDQLEKQAGELQFIAKLIKS